jgi:hypothetical protein
VLRSAEESAGDANADYDYEYEYEDGEDEDATDPLSSTTTDDTSIARASLKPAARIPAINSSLLFQAIQQRQPDDLIKLCKSSERMIYYFCFMTFFHSSSFSFFLFFSLSLLCFFSFVLCLSSSSSL